jgi:hypothetical protein
MENYYLEEFKKEVRELIANYMRSEGCSCCQDIEEHTDVKRRLEELLDCGDVFIEDVDLQLRVNSKLHAIRRLLVLSIRNEK